MGDHAVTPQYVRELKAGGRDHLTVDELVSLKDRGRSWSDLINDVHCRAVSAVNTLRAMLRARSETAGPSKP